MKFGAEKVCGANANAAAAAAAKWSECEVVDVHRHGGRWEGGTAGGVLYIKCRNAFAECQASALGAPGLYGCHMRIALRRLDVVRVSSAI